MCNPLLFLSFHFFKLKKFLKLWFLPARWGWQNLSKMEILLSFLLVTTSLHQNWLKWIYRAESHAVPGLVDAAERSVLIANSRLCGLVARSRQLGGMDLERRLCDIWGRLNAIPQSLWGDLVREQLGSIYEVLLWLAGYSNAVPLVLGK